MESRKNKSKSSVFLLPVKIDEDTLQDELNEILYEMSEKHRGTFISYKDVGAFDVPFWKLLEKLEVYCKANPRTIGKGAGEKLIKILETIETDDDMFPEYEIKLIRDIIDRL